MKVAFFIKILGSKCTEAREKREYCLEDRIHVALEGEY